MNKAVSKLHNDMQRLRKATAAEKKEEAALKKAGADEKAAQARIDAQEKAIIDQFMKPNSTLDAATEQKLMGQIFDLGKQSVQSRAKFEALIAKDKKSIGSDKKAMKADRGQALKDLKPAEYSMNLKDTNRVRKELGLKGLKKVLRKPVNNNPNHVTAAMRRLGRAGYATAMSMGGYVSHGLCATGVSRSLASAFGISVYGNGNQIDENLPRNKFKQIHIPLAQALKIPGLVLTWEHTSTALGSIYGHTAITTGDGHSSCSDFVERDTLAGNRSRTGLKIFMPTF